MKKFAFNSITLSVTIVAAIVIIFTFYADTWGRQNGINIKFETEQNNLKNKMNVFETNIEDIKKNVNDIKVEQGKQKIKIEHILTGIKEIKDNMSNRGYIPW